LLFLGFKFLTNIITAFYCQSFLSDILINSYKQNYKSSFTDDANVVESNNYKINLIQGEDNNIKITTKTDFELINCLM